MSDGQIGQYTLIEQIGQGGMAVVYRAHQPSMNRTVAVKMILGNMVLNEEMRTRFIREAQLIVQLEHPHILPVYDYDAAHDPPYIVMRYLEGATLAQVMEQTSVPFGETAFMLNQIASALDYSHARGVVHRDIKPSNIMLDSEGNAYLMDFGIARSQKDTQTQITMTGASVGTPAYMSPEQAYGVRELDYRTDIYSLGVVLFQLITGQPPFQHPSANAIMFAHVNEQPPAPSSINPHVTPELDALVLKALAKEPDERFQSARELAGLFMSGVGEHYAGVPYTLQATTQAHIEALQAQRAAAPPETPIPPVSATPPPMTQGFDQPPMATFAGPSVSAPAPKQPSTDTGGSRPSPYATTSKPVTPRGSRSGNPILWVVLVILLAGLGVLGYLGTGGSVDDLLALIPSGADSTAVVADNPTATDTVIASAMPTDAAATSTPDVAARATELADERATRDAEPTATLHDVAARATALVEARATDDARDELARDDVVATRVAAAVGAARGGATTPTLSPLQAAVVSARATDDARDADWIPVEREFNGVTMVLVPAGCFMMGSANGNDDERPMHQQCFDEPFWIDKYEVTRANYQLCVDAGVCEPKNTNTRSFTDAHPINYVDWHAMNDYCDWRDARLPTEPEWEYAARGTDNLTYPWGNSWDATSVAYNANSTSAVGSFPSGASWVGAQDMIGNVQEWTLSKYAPYPYDAELRQYDDTPTFGNRVLRGGSFISNPDNMTALYRGYLSNNLDESHNGGRCVRDNARDELARDDVVATRVAAAVGAARGGATTPTLSPLQAAVISARATDDARIEATASAEVDATIGARIAAAVEAAQAADNARNELAREDVVATRVAAAVEAAQNATATRTPLEEALAAAQTNVRGIVLGESVNLRTGPGTNYPVGGFVQRNDILSVNGKYNDWYRVRHEGENRWIWSGGFVVENPSQVPEVRP